LFFFNPQATPAILKPGHPLNIIFYIPLSCCTFFAIASIIYVLMENYVELKRLCQRRIDSRLAFRYPLSQLWDLMDE
jgi:hypothetical protein